MTILKAVMDEPGATAESDLELVRRFCAGEQAAFQQLAQRHWQGVYRVLYRYVRNPADAEDLLQKTFVKALKAIHAVQLELKFKPWLYRIAVNTARDHLRQSQRRPFVVFDEAWVEPTEATGESGAIKRQQRLLLRQAVDQLPPRQRDVLMLRIYRGMSYQEVAESLECSLSAAKVNFHHAMKRLKSVIGGEER